MRSRCWSASACRTRSTSSPRIGRRCGWRSSRKAAEGRGFEVIIAGAGGAAHLPGMTAAHTVLPVLGVPVQSAALNGLDSLLSIVQMPGGVPVATLAIGKAGATNAGLLAIAILATSRPELRSAAARVSRRADGQRSARIDCREPGDPARRHHWRAGQRTARTDDGDRRAAHGLSRAHAVAGRRHADRPGGRRRDHGGLRTISTPSVRSRKAWTSSPSNSRTSPRKRPRSPPSSSRCVRAAPRCT